MPILFTTVRFEGSRAQHTALKLPRSRFLIPALSAPTAAMADDAFATFSFVGCVDGFDQDEGASESETMEAKFLAVFSQRSARRLKRFIFAESLLSACPASAHAWALRHQMSDYISTTSPNR